MDGLLTAVLTKIPSSFNTAKSKGQDVLYIILILPELKVEFYAYSVEYVFPGFILLVLCCRWDIQFIRTVCHQETRRNIAEHRILDLVLCLM